MSLNNKNSYRMIFFRNFHARKRHDANDGAMRFIRGFGGMLPENLCKMVQFGAYLDQILS